jgi:hypothetical protein
VKIASIILKNWSAARIELAVLPAAVNTSQSSIPALECPHQGMGITNRFLYIKAADADALPALAAARINKTAKSEPEEGQSPCIAFFTDFSGTRKWQKYTARKSSPKKSIPQLP